MPSPTILQVRVLIGTPQFPNTLANQNTIFVFSPNGTSRASAFGNLGSRNQNPKEERAYDLNNPGIAGTISVSSFSQVTFDSTDLKNDQQLAGQLATYIERGLIQVADTLAPGVPLARADLMAFV